ncbi:MAG: DUF2946 family protein [Pseudomonadota bacterium]
MGDELTHLLPSLDESVIKAMEKWPDVPVCAGWVGLDERGQWRIKGQIIRHQRTVNFLGQHYRPQSDGAWYVQNGPQKVLIDLAYTPWVYRLTAERDFETHTGLVSRRLTSVYADDDGNLLLDTEYGIGVVDDRDLEAAANCLEIDNDLAAAKIDGRRVAITLVERARVAPQFGFIAHPGDDAAAND